MKELLLTKIITHDKGVKCHARVVQLLNEFNGPTISQADQIVFAQKDYNRL